jgi:hypothetical protein
LGVSLGLLNHSDSNRRVQTARVSIDCAVSIGEQPVGWTDSAVDVRARTVLPEFIQAQNLGDSDIPHRFRRYLKNRLPTT